MKQYNHGVAFCNPYKNPPNQMPKCLLSITTNSNNLDDKNKAKINKILERLDANKIVGYYATFDCYDDKPRKQWSDEAKVKNRLRRLTKRMGKLYSIPELREQAIAEKINQNPSYYSLKT